MNGFQTLNLKEVLLSKIIFHIGKEEAVHRTQYDLKDREGQAPSIRRLQELHQTSMKAIALIKVNSTPEVHKGLDERLVYPRNKLRLFFEMVKKPQLNRFRAR